MDNKNMQGVEAGGFLFLNGADAALAEKEQKQIAYLEKKLDYQNHQPYEREHRLGNSCRRHRLFSKKKIPYKR